MRGAGRVAVTTLATAALLLIAVAPGSSQSTRSWTFEDDAFADLWFHGLAVVGFYGFGPLPLYDPDYAAATRGEPGPGTPAPTSLERDRRELLKRFQGDDAFEVLHFLPLYFHGAGRGPSMAALEAFSTGSRTTPETSAPTRFGGSVVAEFLEGVGERKVLGTFVQDLKEEWGAVVAPRRTRDRDEWARRLTDVRTAWEKEWAPTLAGFLEAEGFTSGTVVAVPGLGPEGRFLERDPAGAPGPLVVLGVPEKDGGAAAALSSLVRELCYPVVRRAFASFEARLKDRVDASRASDLTATRCGELLLERRAPAQVPAYRARFGLPPQGNGRAFLSASGRLPGAAAWEGALDDALLRELKLEPDSGGAHAPPVRRRQ